MKLTKSNFGWIFATFGLAVLLAISIYLGVSGWYFKNDFSYTTDLELGKSVLIEATQNQANAVSFTVDGSYLNGFMLPQIVSIKNVSDQGVYLRAKAYVYTSNGQYYDVEIDSTTNWVYTEDGYYYFNDTVISDEKVTLCKAIMLGDEDEYLTNVKYIVTFVIEALDIEQNVEALWGVNPLNDLTST